MVDFLCWTTLYGVCKFLCYGFKYVALSVLFRKDEEYQDLKTSKVAFNYCFSRNVPNRTFSNTDQDRSQPWHHQMQRLARGRKQWKCHLLACTTSMRLSVVFVSHQYNGTCTHGHTHLTHRWLCHGKLQFVHTNSLACWSPPMALSKNEGPWKASITECNQSFNLLYPIQKLPPVRLIKLCQHYFIHSPCFIYSSDMLRGKDTGLSMGPGCQ